MFKNYLTFTFAQNFHRGCCLVELPAPAKDRLLRSASQMLRHFTRSLHVKDGKEESLCLCTTLLSLRDCRETLEENQAFTGDHAVQYWILHARLEQLCEKASGAEGGQLRMLG